MTAKCGFGYQGQCCCECALHLVAKPRCHHLGGSGVCGPYPNSGDNEMTALAKTVERRDLEAAQEVRYVCLALASDGIAQTDWDEHGSCEAWMSKTLPTAVEEKTEEIEDPIIFQI